MIIQENEVVMLAMGCCFYFFIIAYKAHVFRIPEWKIFLSAYHVVLAGWFFTVLEGFFLSEILNVLEHFCYAFSTVIMAVWCYKITRLKNRAKP